MRIIFFTFRYEDAKSQLESELKNLPELMLEVEKLHFKVVFQDPAGRTTNVKAHIGRQLLGHSFIKCE